MQRAGAAEAALVAASESLLDLKLAEAGVTQGLPSEKKIIGSS
jgi:hypothetical protein